MAKKVKKDNESSIELPTIFMYNLDGNQTEKGRLLRAKLQKVGLSESQIEDHVQVGHILGFVENNRIPLQYLFDFKFRRIKMFIEGLRERDVPLNEILNYLAFVKKENLQRRERLIENAKPLQVFIQPHLYVTKDEVKYFNKNIKAEIKYLERLLEKTTFIKEKKIQDFRHIWLGSKEQLITLFRLWAADDFIHLEENIDGYLSNFTSNDGIVYSKISPTKIKWFRYENELAFFLIEMTKHDVRLLAKKEIWKKSSNIFVNESGKTFKSLAVLSQQTPHNHSFLTRIIQKVLNS